MAAPKNNFSIAGIPEVQKAFRELPNTLAKKVIRQALRAGMKVIKNEAVKLAPKKSRKSKKTKNLKRTGALRKAIKVRAVVRKRNVIGIDLKVGDGDFLGKTFYAAFVEFGTSRMPAHPFMRPAFESKKSEASAIIKQLILEGIEREAKK
jgi:HK97 gp10 family phage protein